LRTVQPGVGARSVCSAGHPRCHGRVLITRLGRPKRPAPSGASAAIDSRSVPGTGPNRNSRRRPGVSGRGRVGLWPGAGGTAVAAAPSGPTSCCPCHAATARHAASVEAAPIARAPPRRRAPQKPPPEGAERAGPVPPRIDDGEDRVVTVVDASNRCGGTDHARAARGGRPPGRHGRVSGRALLAGPPRPAANRSSADGPIAASAEREITVEARGLPAERDPWPWAPASGAGVGRGAPARGMLAVVAALGRWARSLKPRA
jgi:hypothetical protein